MQNTINIAKSEDFVTRHKTSERAFTRHRKLPFFSLIVFLLNQVKGALQDELDAFMQQGDLAQASEQTVSKAAFCKARKYLKPSAFIELNDELVARYYKENSTLTWHGFRVCAVDGSKVALPDTPDLLAEFGGRKNAYAIKPLATLSQCYDVLNEITLDAELDKCASCERDLAYKHLQRVKGNNLFIFDRGYPAFWLMEAHNLRKQAFCMRMPVGSTFQYVNEFAASDDIDSIIELEPNRRISSKCKKYGMAGNKIKLRLVKVTLLSGEVEILATNLLDASDYPYSEFKALYHLRWSVEEDYKQQKHSLKIELFSGKSANSVLQDIHAKILAKNITRLIAIGANQQVEQVNKKRKLSYKVNFKQALSKTKFVILRIVMSPDPVTWIEYLIRQFMRYLEPVRPDRQYPRKRLVGTRGAVSGTYKPTR